MSEASYRASPKPELKSCTKCGTPTDAARLVYAKSGDLVCAACESGTDGEARLARGALGSAIAALVFGFVGTIALVLLVSSLDEVFGLFGRGSGRGTALRVAVMWQAFLVVLIALAARTIAGAHRTLSSPSVRKAIGAKRLRLLLLSWAGIPLVPALALLYGAMFFVAGFLRAFR